MRNDLTALPFAPGQLNVVDNYLEAGLMTAMKAGVSPETVRRPFTETRMFMRKRVRRRLPRTPPPWPAVPAIIAAAHVMATADTRTGRIGLGLPRKTWCPPVRRRRSVARP